MNCEQIRENMPAYALGALSEAEQVEFDQHLSECGLEHEVETLNEVVERLSQAAPEVDPPASLRDRILSAAAADQASLVSTGSAPSGREGLASRLSRFGAPFYSAAAVMLIVIGAVIGWGIASISGDDPSTKINHFRREPGGEWFRVESTLGEEGLMLSVGNLETLSSQTNYYFWAQRDQRWVPIGGFNTNDEGKWSGYFEFALEEGDAVAITVEPASVGEEPSTEAEIQSRI